MALSSRSLLLYGFQVTDSNRWLDFQRVLAGPELSAQLDLGFYSLTGLLFEIKRAMESVDTNNIYSWSADRSINGGLENRVTGGTSGSFLSILFGSGTHASASVASLIGFPATDQTGSTSYTGTSTAGTALISELAGYSYLGPDFDQRIFGAVNVSASGFKEAVVFSLQRFAQVTFRYEPSAKVTSEWTPFMRWAIQQRPFDFTPEVLVSSTVYDVTLESTDSDGKALGFRMPEMLPDFPNLYSTGNLRMRLRV